MLVGTALCVAITNMIVVIMIIVWKCGPKCVRRRCAHLYPIFRTQLYNFRNHHARRTFPIRRTFDVELSVCLCAPSCVFGLWSVHTERNARLGLACACGVDQRSSQSQRHKHRIASLMSFNHISQQQQQQPQRANNCLRFLRKYAGGETARTHA